MERLSDLAIRLVTTNDELLGSIEGLECVMIESVFQANIGNLRRSWMAARRALNVAQLMGLNRAGHKAHYEVLDPGANYHPQLMWFRIRKQLPDTFLIPFSKRLPFLQPMSQSYGHIAASSMLFLNETSALVL